MDTFHDAGHGVLGSLQGNAQPVEGLADAAVVAGAAQLLQAPDLALVTLRVHFQDWDGERFLLCIGVDAHDPAHTELDLTLVAVGRVRDLALEESLFDGGDDAAQLLHAAEVIIRLLLHAVSLGFDEKAAAQRVDGVGHTRLFGDDLLGAQGNGHSMLGGQRQCFVEGVRMQGLCAAEDRGQRLDRHPDHIVLWLLGGQADPGRLRMKAQQPRARIGSLEGLAHLACPDAPGSAVFGDLFEEIVVGVEEE